MYKENNCGYDIIAYTSIAHNTVVLGYNKRKNEYVTWLTSPNRKGGYDIGYYDSNYKNAFKNYEGRCNDMLEKHLLFEKSKTKPKEKVLQDKYMYLYIKSCNNRLISGFNKIIWQLNIPNARMGICVFLVFT